jgi:hypothetical protein
VYEYTVTQYDPKTHHGGLFAEHRDTFIKLKAEACGFPGWVRTAVDENRYVQASWDSEGFRLDKDRIHNNAAKEAWLKSVSIHVGKINGARKSPSAKIISDALDL